MRFEEAIYNHWENTLLLTFREPFNKEIAQKFKHFLVDLGCLVETERDVSIRENRIFIKPTPTS